MEMSFQTAIYTYEIYLKLPKHIREWKLQKKCKHQNISDYKKMAFQLKDLHIESMCLETYQYYIHN